MASCGSPTPGWRRCSESHLHDAQGARETARGWVARAVCGLALLGLLAGCAPTIKYGSLPRTDRLDTLRAGVSSTGDVLLALGEPRGSGMARLISVDQTPRKIWFYEYTEAQGSRIDLKILLVFFHQERYDGHLWFSSAQLLEQAE